MKRTLALLLPAALSAALALGGCMTERADGSPKVETTQEADREGLKGKITGLPKREDVNLPVNEQLIVELYSK